MMGVFEVTLILFIFGINCVVTENHENKPTVPKCCKIDEYVKIIINKGVRMKICKKSDRALDLSDVVVYGKNREKTNYSIQDFFNIMPGKFEINQTFRRNALDLTVYIPKSLIYLSETGLIFEIPNTYERYMPISSENYCADYTIVGNKIKQRFWVILQSFRLKNSGNLESFPGVFKIAMLVTSVFLFMVLVVYALLRELRNLCGMILMAYVASLFSAFLLLAVLRIMMDGNLGPEGCVNLSCSIYFFILAAFCWMNVMSYDIWWTFRGYAKARPIHSRGETFKFLMYCTYAFGVPLAMTIFFRVVNGLDLHHMPWIVKPMILLFGCFLVGGQKFVYLYIPMLIMIVFNWVLYLMTAFNIWRLSRGTAVLDSATAGTPAAHRSHMQRFLVYLKLSIVMGLNWLLEVVSFLLPSLKGFWWISDTYNILIGVIIFIIFVCKPKILKKLVKLMKVQKVRKWISANTTKNNNSIVDSPIQKKQSTQICTHPKGGTSF